MQLFFLLCRKYGKIKQEAKEKPQIYFSKPIFTLKNNHIGMHIPDNNKTTSTTLDERLMAFSELGTSLYKVSEALIQPDEPNFQHISEHSLFDACVKTTKVNPWFTLLEISRALRSLSTMLDHKALKYWKNKHPKLPDEPVSAKNIAVIMAGNIPLVGFHDLLCVVISGHHFTGKLSSQDPYLPLAVAEILISRLPGIRDRISFSMETPLDADAYIATGSDNTARYFTSFFAGRPYIIRGNRSSIAVLSGKENTSDLQQLGEDIFAYFGLGCRSVSHLLVPRGFDFSKLKYAWKGYEPILHHKKYNNNLKHSRALFIAEETPFIDMGIVLLRESVEITPAVSVLNHSYYDNQKDVIQFIKERQHKLQCVVSNIKMDIPNISVVPLGQSQYPVLSDYADGVDTMAFLLKL